MKISLLVCAVSLLSMACSAEPPVYEGDSVRATIPIVDPTPTVEIEGDVRVELPEAPARVLERTSVEYEILCLGPGRPFPDSLGGFREVFDEPEMLDAWVDYLSDTTIVDSNTGIKAFELSGEGSGKWIDSQLRPQLRGHEFTWTLTNVDDDHWSDVDMTLMFDQDYEIFLPLRWRNRQIVNPVLAEGMIVTETRNCDEPEFDKQPLDIDKLWQPVDGPGGQDEFPTIPTTFKPDKLLSVDDTMWAKAGSLFWYRIDSDGQPLSLLQAVKGGASDFEFDGANVWITDTGEGFVHKFSQHGELLEKFKVPSPDRITSDGENLWITTSASSELFKYSPDGNELLEVQLPAKSNAGDRRSGPGATRFSGADLRFDAGRIWVGVEDAWTVDIYNLDGTLHSSTYLHSRPGPMEFDGEHMWVSVPGNGQVWKFDADGTHIDTIELAWSFSVNAMAFSGDSIWLVDTCCERHISGSRALRVDLDGVVSGRYNFAHHVNDVEFDGEHLWFSHDEEKSFTKIEPNIPTEFWRPVNGPYRDMEFNVGSGDSMIAGSLTLPDSPGPHPAVLIVQNVNGGHRDNNWFGTQFGHIYADNFARRGFAVYRYDLPGIGLSPGEMFDYEVWDLADDVSSIIDALQAHPEIDSKQVGVWSLGESLLYALPVVAERDDLAWAIFYNLGGSTVLDSDSAFTLLAARYSDQSEESISEIIRQFRLALEISQNNGDWRPFEEAILESEINAKLAETNFENVVALPFISIRRMESRYFNSIIGMDLGDYVEQITDTPMVSAFGGLNLLIHPEHFEPPLLEAIERSGNPDSRTVTFARMNDILRAANSGRGDEFDLLEPIIYPSFIAPGFIEYMTNWILERTELSGGQ